MISELYLEGVISFGATIAGLLTGSGVAILVLFKSNKNLKENMMKRNMSLAIIALLSLCSISYAQKTVVSGNLNFKSETIYNKMMISEVVGNSIVPVDTIDARL